MSNAYEIGLLDGINEVIGWFKSAREGAEFRGHQMSTFIQVEHRMWFDSWCKACGKDARVNLQPMPNETNVGGPAVAVNCNV